MRNKNFECVRSIYHNNKEYTIMVYGELTEVKDISGFYAIPVTYNSRTNKVKNVELDKKIVIPAFNEYYSKKKAFNMGWAICVEDDIFNREKGVEICKRRFSRSPMTTQNGRFLTNDMCQALVDNEVDYIIKHIDMFLPKVVVRDNDTFNETPPPHLESKLFDEYFFEEAIKKVKTGEFVHYYKNHKKFIGIYNKENERLGHKCHDMFFFAPVGTNGLIDHNFSRFFTSINIDTVFYKATDNDEILVKDYLLGAHGRIWDANRERFQLVID